MRPAVAFVVVALTGAAALICLLPLTAGSPYLAPPEVYAQMIPQHGYRAPGLNAFLPVLAGVLVITICTGLYVWLTDLPRTIRYKPRKRTRR